MAYVDINDAIKIGQLSSSARLETFMDLPVKHLR